MATNPLAYLWASLLSMTPSSQRQQSLQDREHTEMREDTVYQRGVEDMRKAGLNPYTIGANPAPASSSDVGEQSIAYRLQLLGNILDIGNLSVKNRKVTNDLIGDVLGMFKIK